MKIGDHQSDEKCQEKSLFNTGILGPEILRISARKKSIHLGCPQFPLSLDLGMIPAG